MIPKCFDQFAILHGDYYTSVCLNKPTEPEILESREVRGFFLTNFKILLNFPF
jgi:hypothetical protein